MRATEASSGGLEPLVTSDSGSHGGVSDVGASVGARASMVEDVASVATSDG